jgi:hypothetical protein
MLGEDSHSPVLMGRGCDTYTDTQRDHYQQLVDEGRREEMLVALGKLVEPDPRLSGTTWYGGRPYFTVQRSKVLESGHYILMLGGYVLNSDDYLLRSHSDVQWVKVSEISEGWQHKW